MKYKEILYPGTLEILKKIHLEVEGDYQSEVDEFRQDELFENLSTIETMIEKIEQYIESDELGEPCLAVLLNDIKSMNANTASWEKGLLIISIFKTIEDSGDLDLDDDIGLNVEEFELCECSEAATGFSMLSIAHVEGATSDNYCGYVDARASLDELIPSFDEGGFSSSFLSLYVRLVMESGEDNVFNPLLVKRKNIGSINSVFATLKLLAAAKGHVVHSNIQSSTFQVPVYIREKLNPFDSYHQFNETITILSQINDKNDVLDKFLSVYHILESFMFKVPIVNLGDNYNYDFFSIRDFQALYTTTKVNELDGLKRLFSKAEMGQFWNRKIEGKSFEKIIKDRIKSLVEESDFDKAKCNIVVSKLGVRSVEDVANIKKGSFNANDYSDILYKLRNSIVHNKETEIHISYFNLSNSLARFIDYIFIQPVLLLAYDLISDPSSKVWYKGAEFKLYEKIA